MASRTSTLVRATKGALLYHNNSTKAQLVTIHGASNVSTENPAATVVLNTGSGASLNFETNKWTVTTGANVLSLGIGTNGTQAYSNTQADYSYMGDASGNSYKTNNDYYDRFINADPWMFIKPSEYGNKNDNTLSYVGTNANQQVGGWNNILSDYRTGGKSIGDILGGGLESPDASHNPSYSSRGLVYCQYSQAFIGHDANAQSTMGLRRQGSGGFETANLTSNGSLYSNTIGTGQDPANFYVSGSTSNSWSPPLMAEGGIFVYNYKRYNNDNRRTTFLPGGRALYKGTLPTDHSQTDATAVPLTSGITMNDMGTANSARYSYIQSQNGDEFQWMKYHRAKDKYYVCFKSGSGNSNHAGIWSFDYSQSTDNPWTEAGIAGGGPNGDKIYESPWTQEAEYPVALTNRTTIPAKIGTSLWLMYDDANAAYFSEDLITWQAASSYLDSGYLIKNQDASGIDFFQKSDGQIVTVSAGIAEMDQAGVLEKSTAIGNYTRNGLVLNPNDSIYVANESKTADISFTVTEVEI